MHTSPVLRKLLLFFRAHVKLLDELREQRAQRRCAQPSKETILNVIGRPLDDQLAYEAFTGYSGAANPPVVELLKNFADKTDKGRAGKNKTEL